MSQVNRKKKCISLAEKNSIIADIESGKTQKKVATERNYSLTTINTIWKMKEKIQQATSGASAYHPKRARIRTGEYSHLEEVLLIWFSQARRAGKPITGHILQTQAQLIAMKLGIDFAASRGWLERFKKRHSIVHYKVSGEARDVDATTVDAWKNIDIPAILKKYAPKDIFNIDETGLFYKATPDKTLSFKGDPCVGGKQSKERITVLVGANMDGSEKLPLLTIGKFANPRCFKNVVNIPCEYKNNSKAWMTSTLFKEWIQNLDARFHRENRKILLLLDNCPAHICPETLLAIEVKYFPANATSVLQPCDMGIIRCLKVFYRNILVQSQLQALENDNDFKVSLLDALSWLVFSWAKVNRTTIKNCFAKSGFKLDDFIEHPNDNVDQDFLKKYDDYIDMDIDVETAVNSLQPLEDIIQLVKTKDLPCEEEEEEDEEEKPTPVISSSDIHKSLDILRRGALTLKMDKKDVDKTLHLIAELTTQFNKIPKTQKLIRCRPLSNTRFTWQRSSCW